MSEPQSDLEAVREAEPAADDADEPAGPESALRRELRVSDAAALTALVHERLRELGPAEAREILRNVFVTTEVIDLLADQAGLLRAHEVRREIAAHPRSREIVAMRFVPGLFWRDLVGIGRDVRVRPTVRRAADLALLERLAALSVGERVSIARGGSSAVLARLSRDPTPRVIEALLENPRLTEGLLLQLAAAESTPPSILALLAASPRWGVNYALRVSLARNPRTPPATVLPLLAGLRKQDLRAVAREPRLHPILKQRAQLLLGE